jgi:hypothetical protein
LPFHYRRATFRLWGTCPPITWSWCPYSRRKRN